MGWVYRSVVAGDFADRLGAIAGLIAAFAATAAAVAGRKRLSEIARALWDRLT